MLRLLPFMDAATIWKGSERARQFGCRQGIRNPGVQVTFRARCAGRRFGRLASMAHCVVKCNIEAQTGGRI